MNIVTAVDDEKFHLVTSSFQSLNCKPIYWCVETTFKNKEANDLVLYRASLTAPGLEVCAIKYAKRLGELELFITFLGEGTSKAVYTFNDKETIRETFNKIEAALEEIVKKRAQVLYTAFLATGGRVN